MSALSLLLSFSAMAIYGYSLYFINTDPKLLSIHKFSPSGMKKYGQLKFLTYHCLCIQLASSTLHFLAHLAPSWFRHPRDFLFKSLAYPVGSIVCYTFWGVWFLLGRELIFPSSHDEYYPVWLNHATHSIIAPINILLSLIINHGRLSSLNTLVCLGYFGFYIGLLYYIKFDTGVFVYPYIEKFNDTGRIAYFGSVALLAYFMLKSGDFLTRLTHGHASQLPASKKIKQK